MKTLNLSAKVLAMNALRRLRSLIIVPCATLIVGLVGQSALAQPTVTPAVDVNLTQHKVSKGKDGKEVLGNAAFVKPGDVIEYRATYTNRSANAVKNVVASLPIPEGLQYQPMSAKPGAAIAQASVKGGAYGAEPLTRKVSGKVEPVPYADYRSLRWNLGELPAGGVAVVSARAAVQVFVPTAASGVQGAGSLSQAPPATASKVPAASKP